MQPVEEWSMEELWLFVCFADLPFVQPGVWEQAFTPLTKRFLWPAHLLRPGVIPSTWCQVLTPWNIPVSQVARAPFCLLKSDYPECNHFARRLEGNCFPSERFCSLRWRKAAVAPTASHTEFQCRHRKGVKKSKCFTFCFLKFVDKFLNNDLT